MAGLRDPLPLYLVQERPRRLQDRRQLAGELHRVGHVQLQHRHELPEEQTFRPRLSAVGGLTTNNAVALTGMAKSVAAVSNSDVPLDLRQRNRRHEVHVVRNAHRRKGVSRRSVTQARERRRDTAARRSSATYTPAGRRPATCRVAAKSTAALSAQEKRRSSSSSSTSPPAYKTTPKPVVMVPPPK